MTKNTNTITIILGIIFLIFVILIINGIGNKLFNLIIISVVFTTLICIRIKSTELKIIVATICIYLFAMIYALAYGVDSYIDEKVSRLKTENRNKIIEIFEKYDYDLGRRIYDVGFSPTNKVEYDKVTVPKKPILQPSDHYEFKDGKLITTPGDSITELDRKMYNHDLEQWKDYYDNISKLYLMKSKNWQLLEIYYQGEKGDMFDNFGSPYFDVYGIFPYAIGYFKQEYSSYFSYEPSVESALDNAFNFWTTSDNSTYIQDGTFAKGNYDKAFKELKNCNNDYFWLLKEREEDIDVSMLDDSRYRFGLPIPFDNIPGKSVTYMYNGYYKVYNSKVWISRWSVKRQQWRINGDKESLRIKISIGLTLLLLLIIVPLLIEHKRKQKRQSETLYDKLKRLCNPSNFLKNYDKEKVDAANALYQRILNTNHNDNDSLNEIQKLAVEQLNISLIDYDLLNELKKKVNPQNYMKHYNAEKVSLANDLFSRLNSKNLTYNEFEEIQELSKKL